ALKLIVGNNIARVAREQRNKHIWADVCGDDVHRPVAESKKGTARMKAVDFFVVIAIEKGIATVVVDDIPVVAIGPGATALRLAAVAGNSAGLKNSKYIFQWST